MNRRIKENRVQCYLSHLEGLPLFYVVVAVVVLWRVGGGGIKHWDRGAVDRHNAPQQIDCFADGVPQSPCPSLF